ncbi:choice-of-anchor I family protein [Flavobacterium subsaxonicum]|uniref:choice-of-anchor I family protein n=1 Tax=Flavobacterium subsaxonicum TaxID=426226 RepID=UPI000429CCD4|nr:choice-of-anchor I family protein [Flavobacterium subsaxonicum]
MPLLCCMLAHAAGAQTVVHYWNFNNSASEAAITAVSQTLVGTPTLTAVAGGTSLIDFASGTGQNFATQNLNAQNSDEAGTHLRFNNPIGGALVFALPTTGYENPIVKFATKRSGSGAGNQLWSYSTDGTTYTSFATIAPIDGDPALATLDFSAIAAADNNANFKLKVEFEQGPGGIVGNNRFDNFTLTGTVLVNPTVIHYWNFNNSASEAAITAVSQTLVGAPTLTAVAGGTSLIDFASGTGQNFATLNLNAQNGDEAGTHLRFNNPIGGALVFAVPTTGYENAIVKFATKRSGSGAGNQLWSYSTDGSTYISFATIAPIDGDPALATLDFSAIAGADNNANFKIKVEFEQGSGGAVGNNRFDNLTVTATPMEGTVDVTAPVVTFAPANAATNILISAHPAITFNEDVRLADNSAITNTNVDALVALRLNNATGAVVPFDATFAANTITITPATPLLNGQQYYVALLANTVEDMNNNAVAEVQSSTFTTIAVQTAFAAGDMAFTAYRMNATSTEDDVALVTFVDIAAGTFINLTDSKYTTNAQAQCANGIVWTATSCVPAGSVITIQTSALVANTGTVTGSGFGLSSGGDQVIVYTGTAAAANYITALTSNGWAAANTECGGSVSMLPAGLTDGASAANLSTAPGNITGNTVNAFYNGTQAGTPAQLKTAILNPANWTGVAGATAPQTWPTWAFPSSPNVQTATVLNNTTIQLVFNNELNAASAATTANYTGVAGLTTAVAVGNTVTLTYSTPFTAGTAYELTVNNLIDEDGLTMACAYTFNFNYTATVAFATDFVVVNENAGTLNFVINLTSPVAGSVDLVVKGAPFSTADSADFTLATQTLNFTGTSSLTQTITIPIIDDTLEEQHAEYFVLSLENAVNVAITGESLATIYIKDNDRLAKVPSQDIQLDYVTSFDPSGANESTCEIVVFDAASKKLFATSAVEGRLDIIDFTNPEAPVTTGSINMTPYGGVTSVAVKNGVVAVASPNANEQLDGSVVFFTTAGVFIKQVTVGALPDNISFTQDGTKVLTANEGQPNANYTVDPEGSVSIIDITGGIASLTNDDVTTLLFTAYNSASAESALIASGVRKLYASSTMSQDFEPEYVTSSADSQKAWVTLQENNAVAEINLVTKTITSVWALGTKDMSLPGNGFDVSDNNNEVLIANWPVQAYFIPDGAANYNVGGTNYIVTANEGDEKEYGSFVERTTIGAASYNLDATEFPEAAMLKKSHNAGRLRVTNLDGLNDAGTAYNGIYALGSRSFSIFNADTKQIVFDSGDDFEMYTASASSINPIFNSDHEDNSFKSRSRAKGPEAEGVTVAEIMGKTYAFISLERIGGVMVYDVTNPNAPTFVDYKNSRSVSAYTGDHGPEGITYINPTDSPNSKPYIVIANEISGTLTIFEVNTENLGTGDFVTTPKTFVVFPNPSVSGVAYFNRVADIEVYDYSGKLIQQAKQALTIDTSKMATGIYIIKTSEGIVKKLIVK